MALTRYKVLPNLQQDKRVQPRSYIVQHDPGPSRQRLQTTQRKRLHYVKATKEYKTRQEVFPIEGNPNQRNHLPGNFVDNHKPRIFNAAFARYHG